MPVKRNKLLSVLLASFCAMVAAGLLAWWLSGVCGLRGQPAVPVTIHYAREWNGHPCFSVSNRTDRPLIIGVSGVEAASGSTWSNGLQRMPLWELEFPRIGPSPNIVLPPHAEEDGSLLLPSWELPAGPWRATVVVLRRANRTERTATMLAGKLRHWHLLPRLAPSQFNGLSTGTMTAGPYAGLYKPIYQTVTEPVSPAMRKPPALPVLGRASPEALDKARAALRQRLTELEGTNAAAPAAASPASP